MDGPGEIDGALIYVVAGKALALKGQRRDALRHKRFRVQSA